MREIKFRLKSSVGNIVGYEKWYVGAMDSKNFYIAKPRWLYSKNGEKWNPEPINHRLKDQYTGLKDKKRTKEYPEGQEIYEGDIVLGSVGFGEARLEVKWFGEKHGNCWYPFNHAKGSLCDVIGNIYETPELLDQ